MIYQRLLFALVICSCLAGPRAQAELQADLQPKQQPEQRPKLQFINGSPHAVELFWLKSNNQRVSNGLIEPGRQRTIETSIGHRFVVVDQHDRSETMVTCEVPIQAFRVGGVPALYTQQADAHGFPIVASAKVSPYALREAVYIVDLMLAKRPDVRDAMIKSGARLCIMAYNEFTTDLPEWEWLAHEAVPGFENVSIKDYRDTRSRGMGGSETDPYCSCAEENLLAYPGDPYSTENILIHELAHNIHLRGMMNVDPTFDVRVRAAYDSAKAQGLWKGKYASVNHHEYFAEGVQSWFDDNREHDHDHNHVNTRAELIEYDPGLAGLCREVFGDTEFRYTKPGSRLTGHLAGYDPNTAPRFAFPERLDKVRQQIRAAAQKRSDDANAESRSDLVPQLSTAASLAAQSQRRIDREDFPVWWSPQLPEDIQRDVTSKGQRLAAQLDCRDSAQASKIADLITQHFSRVWAWHQQVDTQLNAAWSAWDQARDNTGGKQKDELRALMVWTEQIAPIVAEFTPQVDGFLRALEQEIGPEKTTMLLDLITRSPGAKRTYDAYLEMVPEMTDAQKAILWNRMVQARHDALSAWSDKQIVKIFKAYKVRNELSIDHFGYGYQQRYQTWAKAKK